MQNTRSLCKNWADKTYQEGLDDLNISDISLYDQAQNIFSKLNILNIPMDGYSCEKLPKTEEGRTGVKKTYSEIFHEELEKENFTPASYLIRLIRECNDSNTDDQKIAGALARGLRTLTSLMREPDFAYQIIQELKKYDSNVSAQLNASQDSGDHTDVLLNYKNTNYRIWLYQFSSRGLPHDVERLTGKRGELPNGIHLICPLHTELALAYDSLRKKKIRLESKLSVCEKNLSECSERAIKRKEHLNNQIEKYQLELSEIIPALSSEKEHSENELEIINGWFFYSSKYIQRTAEYINSNSVPTDYSDVMEILTGPEKFISQIRSFKKG